MIAKWTTILDLSLVTAERTVKISSAFGLTLLAGLLYGYPRHEQVQSKIKLLSWHGNRMIRSFCFIKALTDILCV